MATRPRRHVSFLDKPPDAITLKKTFVKKNKNRKRIKIKIKIVVHSWHVIKIYISVFEERWKIMGGGDLIVVLRIALRDL